jgi:hypothetical protein
MCQERVSFVRLKQPIISSTFSQQMNSSRLYFASSRYILQLGSTTAFVNPDFPSANRRPRQYIHETVTRSGNLSRTRVAIAEGKLWMTQVSCQHLLRS